MEKVDLLGIDFPQPDRDWPFRIRVREQDTLNIGIIRMTEEDFADFHRAWSQAGMPRSFEFGEAPSGDAAPGDLRLVSPLTGEERSS